MHMIDMSYWNNVQINWNSFDYLYAPTDREIEKKLFHLNNTANNDVSNLWLVSTHIMKLREEEEDSYQKVYRKEEKKRIAFLLIQKKTWHCATWLAKYEHTPACWPAQLLHIL